MSSIENGLSGVSLVTLSGCRNVPSPLGWKVKRTFLVLEGASTKVPMLGHLKGDVLGAGGGGNMTVASSGPLFVIVNVCSVDSPTPQICAP